MKWLQENLITILLAIVNIFQAITAYSKNKLDADNARQAEVNRNNEAKRKADLENKKLENEVTIEKQKLNFEIEKLNLDSQYTTNKTYVRIQQIFEQYMTEMITAVNGDSFPYTFSETHVKLESLVMFYCPESIETIKNFNTFNVPFENSGSQISKDDYIDEAKFRCQTIVYEHLIKELNNKLSQLIKQ